MSAHTCHGRDLDVERIRAAMQRDEELTGDAAEALKAASVR